MQDKKIIISAAGINTGGGLVLFRSLMRALQGSNLLVLLDVRLRQEYGQLVVRNEAFVVKKSVLARLYYNYRVSRIANRGDILFCFNSLPPLVKSDAYSITYVHSPQFVGLHRDSQYSLKDRLRFIFEIAWFKLFYRNSNTFWVQTKAMQDLLSHSFKDAKVEVVPFLDDDLQALVGADAKQIPANRRVRSVDFFYPASNAGHKNHRRLFLAFAQLAKRGVKSKLLVTLPDKYFEQLMENTGATNVTNLGPLSRVQVLQIMEAGAALIFPSKAETFGIPLIEASKLGVPILAAERDYVRSVCDPNETFDPDSVASIVAAVQRFLGLHRPVDQAQFLSADSFVNRLKKLS